MMPRNDKSFLAKDIETLIENIEKYPFIYKKLCNFILSGGQLGRMLSPFSHGQYTPETHSIQLVFGLDMTPHILLHELIHFEQGCAGYDITTMDFLDAYNKEMEAYSAGISFSINNGIPSIELGIYTLAEYVLIALKSQKDRCLRAKEVAKLIKI